MSETIFDKPRKVYIDWRGAKEKDWWHWYWWRGAGYGMVFLEGRCSPDGDRFTGGMFWAPVDTIETIVEVDDE